MSDLAFEQKVEMTVSLMLSRLREKGRTATPEGLAFLKQKAEELVKEFPNAFTPVEPGEGRDDK